MYGVVSNFLNNIDTPESLRVAADDGPINNNAFLNFKLEKLTAKRHDAVQYSDTAIKTNEKFGQLINERNKKKLNIQIK